MEILGKLGIDLKLLIAQIVNFGLLLWILKRFLYKPVIKRIEKDEKELEQSRNESEKLKKEQTTYTKQKEEETKQARQKARQIITEAEEMAEKIKIRIKTEAESEKEKTIKQIQARLKEINDDQARK